MRERQVVLEALSGVTGVYGRQPAGRCASVVRGSLGMVSAAHPAAARVGAALLRDGGTAFDAAVGTAAALGVVEPMMSGIGGYGTIVVHCARRGETRYLNASARIPHRLDAAAFRPPAPDHEGARRGARSISTPGAVPAWQALHEWGGRLPWARLLDPAIVLAEDGFPLLDLGAAAVESAFPALPAAARAVYGRDGRPLRTGERLVQRDLGRTLREIAAAGADAVRRGAIAARIAAACASRDGFLTADDLAGASAEWWAPLAMDYRGVTVTTAAPPATSFSALVRLGVMSRFDVAALGAGSPETMLRFAAATAFGAGVRVREAGDPDVRPVDLARLLSPAYWEEVAHRIRGGRVWVPTERAGSDGANTTHFVVADAEGSVVSATLTLGELFGSRIWVEGTGIWLNNSLAYAAWEPAGNPMEPRPGGRKLSGDVPTILFRDGRPWIALGTPGGHTIDQVVPQLVMNLVDLGMDLGGALEAPRIAHVAPDLLLVEPSIGAEARAALAAVGHRLVDTAWPMIGNAQALELTAAGDGSVDFLGASDPRGEGAAVPVRVAAE
jgi:gamma-glutamyltranspeptidase / glutathione hydrolase